MARRFILKKTFEFGLSTLLSRILGLIREAVQIRYLGVGVLSDAFIAAYKLPNFLRRIFAEGALSAAFVPELVKLIRKKERKAVDGLMTSSFLFFEGIVLLICLFVVIFPQVIITIFTPGFSGEQVEYAIPLLRILISLIFFLSSSALLGGALHSVNHFFITAFGPAIMNIVYILTLILCIFYKLPVSYLAFGVLLAGAINFLMHLIIFFLYKFTFRKIIPESVKSFKSVLGKFLPCLFGVGVVELNLLIDGQISSFLPKGTYTILYYGQRFMNIPLGMFAVAFSTVLLPHFSRVFLYAPRRMNLYLVEVVKFITWVILPAIFFLCFTAEKLFSHLLTKYPQNVDEAAVILIIYSIGLIFFCINKVLNNMYYAMKDTRTPTIMSAMATGVNIVFNIAGMYFFGSYGIAAATTISGFVLTGLLIYYLQEKYDIKFHVKRFLIFSYSYLIHLLVGMFFFVSLHKLACYLFSLFNFYFFFCVGMGYWIFTIPLFILTMVFMFYIKKLFKLKVYFLD